MRRYAVDAVELDAVGLFALRERLLEDTHGPVRAAAAERLARAARAIFDQGPPTRAQAHGWLLESLHDPLPSVRELACRAVARHAERDDEIESRLAQMLSRDPLWRVRRAAARSLAAVAGEAAIPALITGLEDPFWRVRHGVVQALGLIVSRASKLEQERARLRLEVLRAGADLQEAARAALAYLASGWPEGEDEIPEVLGIIRDPGAGLELADADPAVVTARLQASKTIDPDALVPLLAESHVPLREEAARRLAMVEDPRCLIPALAWLEDPRVPNAPSAVWRLLDRLGARAQLLAEHALAQGRAAALVWAAAWVGTYAADHLHARLLEHAGHPQAEVRAAVVTALGRVLARERGVSGSTPSRVIVEQSLGDPSRLVRDAAALALLELPDASSFDRHVHELARFGARVRARLLERLDNPAVLSQALEDVDVRVRVAALQRCELGPELRARALADADPWIRRAALDLEAGSWASPPPPRFASLRAAEPCHPGDAAAASLLGQSERDPTVRRAAARLLVRHRELLDPPRIAALVAKLHDDPDPWIRARTAELIDPSSCDDDQLSTLLLATRDRAAMTRASAAAQLDAVPELTARLEQLLANPGPIDLRIAAWSRLVTELGSDPQLASERIAAGLQAETEAVIVSHLRELSVLFGADLPAWSPREPARVETSLPARSSPRPQIARRALGSTGIELAPLVLSGRFSPSPASLAVAVERGVDTLFWEPAYTSATRFLRQPGRRDLQVITGSFHADRRSLIHDVELARRRLRRDHIDLFLLFWVRSPARLDAAALDTLRELQQRGWIRSYGFSTHDRAIACAAIETGDWPVIMTRHSAAHDGAERELLPAAAAAGVGVLGFSALCYGRMLRPSAVFESGPAAADCYRYSLSAPAVAACISAPQRHRELLENLAVLDAPTLDAARQEVLRAHGKEIYADSKRFDRLLRRGGTAPLREAILELFEQATEAPEAFSQASPPPSASLRAPEPCHPGDADLRARSRDGG